MKWCWKRRSTGRPAGWSPSMCVTLPMRLAALGFGGCGHAMRGWRFEDMRRSNVALRLQESILEEARRVSETEGVALNQFINVAVAEKLSALRTEGYFREHGQRGDVARAKRLLKRAGRGNPPVAGDEVG